MRAAPGPAAEAPREPPSRQPRVATPQALPQRSTRPTHCGRTMSGPWAEPRTASGVSATSARPCSSTPADPALDRRGSAASPVPVAVTAPAAAPTSASIVDLSRAGGNASDRPGPAERVAWIGDRRRARDQCSRISRNQASGELVAGDQHVPGRRVGDEHGVGRDAPLQRAVADELGPVVFEGDREPVPGERRRRRRRPRLQQDPRACRWSPRRRR
jgi:hypothetical protein